MNLIIILNFLTIVVISSHGVIIKLRKFKYAPNYKTNCNKLNNLYKFIMAL
jgi:hypothetical protein